MANLEYRIIVDPLPPSLGGGFIARVPTLPGCVSDGDTPQSSISSVMYAIAAWIDEAKATGREVPPPDLLEEEAGDMVSLRKDITGVDNTVFVSTKGYGRHAARIKIAIDPPHSFNETCKNASMAIHNYGLTGEYVPPRIVEQAKNFIDRNRDVLMGYWDAEFDTGELFKRLRPPG